MVALAQKHSELPQVVLVHMVLSVLTVGLQATVQLTLMEAKEL